MMAEEDRDKPSETKDATNVTSGEMSDALDAVKAASPALAGALDAAGVTPAGLADSHDRATSDEPDTEKPAGSEQA